LILRKLWNQYFSQWVDVYTEEDILRAIDSGKKKLRLRNSISITGTIRVPKNVYFYLERGAILDGYGLILDD